ncbi:P-loop containing nucleoside triphosphate hydrolase protein [Pleurotus eryngii]|uniref:P-loop containing nucleoside triphosphate hydrolase protein n=1 Tax=Pleurotus eryngii TaxID=5323 RepID=A0A9P6D9E6_PLEER|nr:P-loop containing nucleoside triphosphate hydrolase protein [Pleurotus eryngii]
MHRRFSTLLRASPKSSSVDLGSTIAGDHDDTESKAGTVKETTDLPPPSLKLKRVDYYYSKWSKGFKYRNTSSTVTPEARPLIGSDNDPWKDFAFVIVRTIPKQENLPHTFKVVIKSPYILQACKDVIISWPGISWNSEPLELEPEIFITFLPNFIEYRDKLAAQKTLTTEERYRHSSVSLLISTFQQDYRVTLAKIQTLTSHAEITFDLLYAILVPRTTFFASCAVTGEPRLFTLSSVSRTSVEGKPCYALTCESVDIVDSNNSNASNIPGSTNVSGTDSNGSVSVGRVGRVQTTIILLAFRGTVQITSLDSYPLKFHRDPEGLKARLLERGKKWRELSSGGAKHVEYHGNAALKCAERVVRHNVNSRIMVDRATFRRLNANYQFPAPVPPKANAPVPPHLRNVHGDYDGYDMYGNPVQAVVPTTNNGIQTTRINEVDEDLTDEELILTPAVVYGFSLSDKVWLEFNIQKVSPVDWALDAFANLVLPQGRKTLLQSLVEAHHRELGFDDFIKGKGHGLVINLFGPPGVGKTFSAEATSEHVKRPLYIVGGGDLGTKAADLDAALERIFDVATAWKAIVLIDEADVFLEQRSLHDLERNAMVAVFLRHVEYYRGILFLTTNRVKAFDEAFLSRIHVALHFRELSFESKKQVWQAFIAKAGAKDDITAEEIGELAKKNVNGRQIKNAARTAQSLAIARNEKLAYGHLMETLEAMDEFTREFEGIRANA